MPDATVPAPGPVLEDRRTFTWGPFTITPYLVDHSAFDAYAFLVEADGRRVFYSGDFRAHGRKGRLFDQLLGAPPKDLDVLLMEASSLGRLGLETTFETEDALELRFAESFQTTPGLAMVQASAQNIDRIVTIFRAAKRSRRRLVLDLYPAAILEATGKDSIPQSDWPQVALPERAIPPADPDQAAGQLRPTEAAQRPPDLRGGAGPESRQRRPAVPAPAHAGSGTGRRAPRRAPNLNPAGGLPAGPGRGPAPGLGGRAPDPLQPVAYLRARGVRGPPAIRGGPRPQGAGAHSLLSSGALSCVLPDGGRP